jgi:hypothetical protein
MRIWGLEHNKHLNVIHGEEVVNREWETKKFNITKSSDLQN